MDPECGMGTMVLRVDCSIGIASVPFSLFREARNVLFGISLVRPPILTLLSACWVCEELPIVGNLMATLFDTMFPAEYVHGTYVPYFISMCHLP